MGTPSFPQNTMEKNHITFLIGHSSYLYVIMVQDNKSEFVQLDTPSVTCFTVADADFTNGKLCIAENLSEVDTK